MQQQSNPNIVSAGDYHRQANGSSPASGLDLPQFFERVEYLQPRAAEMFVVAGDDGKIVSARGGRDVAVFDRHPLASFLQLPFLFSPHMGDKALKLRIRPCSPATSCLSHA